APSVGPLDPRDIVSIVEGLVCLALSFQSLIRPRLLNPYCRQRGDRRRLTRAVPCRPAVRMQPGMASGFGAERQERIVSVCGVAAAQAATGRRALGIAIEPLDDTTGEGARLAFRTRQDSVEPDNVHRPLFEER